MLQGRIVIKHDLDDELDRLKWTFSNLEAILAEIEIDLPAKLQRLNANADKRCSIVYYPQLGFLLSIDIDDPNSVVNDLIQSSFIFQVGALSSYILI